MVSFNPVDIWDKAVDTASSGAKAVKDFVVDEFKSAATVARQPEAALRNVGVPTDKLMPIAVWRSKLYDKMGLEDTNPDNKTVTENLYDLGNTTLNILGLKGVKAGYELGKSAFSTAKTVAPSAMTAVKDAAKIVSKATANSKAKKELKKTFARTAIDPKGSFTKVAKTVAHNISRDKTVKAAYNTIREPLAETVVKAVTSGSAVPVAAVKGAIDSGLPRAAVKFAKEGVADRINDATEIYQKWKKNKKKK